VFRFIVGHRDRFGVAAICRVLTGHGVRIAPRTFHGWAARVRSKRSLWDATITGVLAGYYEPGEHGRKKPESLYGSLKMWAHLQREGILVAKSTVERLMRLNGWLGMRGQKKVRTTIPGPAAQRAPDLVGRRFTVPAPNRLLVADFTYVKLVTGAFCYVAFVIDAYAGAIVGWEGSASKETWFVESALRQAAALRSRQGRPIQGAIHHSDAGSQGEFNRSSQHWLAELRVAVRSVLRLGSSSGVSCAAAR
jgi:putative transposase